MPRLHGAQECHQILLFLRRKPLSFAVLTGGNGRLNVFATLISENVSPSAAVASALPLTLHRNRSSISTAGDARRYGVVNLFTGLVTPSLLPLGSIESTV